MSAEQHMKTSSGSTDLSLRLGDAEKDHLFIYLKFINKTILQKINSQETWCYMCMELMQANLCEV